MIARTACAAARQGAWAAACTTRHGTRRWRGATSTALVCARAWSFPRCATVAAGTTRRWCGCGTSASTRTAARARTACRSGVTTARCTAATRRRRCEPCTAVRTRCPVCRHLRRHRLLRRRRRPHLLHRRHRHRRLHLRRHLRHHHLHHHHHHRRHLRHRRRLLRRRLPPHLLLHRRRRPRLLLHLHLPHLHIHSPQILHCGVGTLAGVWTRPSLLASVALRFYLMTLMAGAPAVDASLLPLGKMQTLLASRLAPAFAHVKSSTWPRALAAVLICLTSGFGNRVITALA